MKIAFFALNQNFCKGIIEELQKHHTVRVYKHSDSEDMNLTNIIGLINWSDLIYCDFIHYPLPQITHLQWLDKPVVTRMDGIDILEHIRIDWRRVKGLVLMEVQEPRLMRLRQEWNQEHPNQKLTNLPAKILRRSIGIDLDLFHPRIRRKPTYKICLHSSVIRETKGIYIALQMFNELLQRNPEKPWELYLIGQWEGGWDWANRQEYVMSCNELLSILNIPHDRLFITPFNHPREKWAEIIRDMDLYWCFSIREGFPNSMGEACASGVYPITNHWAGAELIYPEKHICDSPLELMEKTIAWGNLSENEKTQEAIEIRKHIEKQDLRETVKQIRLFCEEIELEYRRN